MPKSEQQNLQLAVLSIQLLHEQVVHLAEEASTAATPLLHVVRYSVPLANSAVSAGRAGQDGAEDSGGAK